MVTTTESASLSEQFFRLDNEMTELHLLLPSRQAAALERAATKEGLTSAQLTRRLIGAFLDKAVPYLPRPEGIAGSSAERPV
jgi:hypothetical protein